MRILRFTKAGWAYLGFTVLVGIAALFSRNNLYYLFESMLLSAIILSGVLSEMTVWSVSFTLVRRPAIAAEKSRDWIRIHNKRRRNLYCVQIGLWEGKKWIPLAFLPKLGAKTSVLIPSEQIFGNRGVFKWDSLVVSTTFPFGLGIKSRSFGQAGQRLIWPLRVKPDHFSSALSSGRKSLFQGPELSEGEVRPKTEEDDLRDVLWTRSQRGDGYFVRMRRSAIQEVEFVLDLRKSGGEEFERTIMKLASRLYELNPSDDSGARLVIRGQQGQYRLEGRVRILDELAVIRSEVDQT